MRLLRYVSVPWTVLLVYSLFSFFLGHNGLYARRHLEAEYLRLAENRAALRAEGEAFAAAGQQLLTDDDALSVHARRLGFGNPGDEVVRVVGLGIAANSPLPPGQALRATEPASVPNRTITAIAMFFGAVVLVFLLVGDILLAAGTRNRRGAVRVVRES